VPLLFVGHDAWERWFPHSPVMGTLRWLRVIGDPVSPRAGTMPPDAP
jgi:hypothetical protein